MPLSKKVIEHLTFTDHLIARIDGVISSYNDNSSKYIKVIIFAFRMELAQILSTVLLLASGHLSRAFGISRLCFLAGWAENWAKLYMQLPIDM